jgi:2-phosphoglycerate kinase
LVVELMLMVEDEASHRDHFGLRERQTHDRRDQDVYLEHFREIRILQEYLLDRARAERVPVVDATDFDHAVDKALEHVLASLLVRGLADGPEPLGGPMRD